jgi:NADPH-dependent 2,4-dienoyl-CoA reductase/sulfur reductase-like enzyme
VLPKLSSALEAAIPALGIELILNERVVVPSPGAAVAEGEWDGSFGALGGIKRVKTVGGKTVEADYVFVSIGNKPNSAIVQKADPAAVKRGLVVVDEFLRVSGPGPSHSIAAISTSLSLCGHANPISREMNLPHVLVSPSEWADHGLQIVRYR